MKKITLVPIDQFNDFSFDILCRLPQHTRDLRQSAKYDKSPLERGGPIAERIGTGCVDRIKKYGVLNPIWICNDTLIAGFEQYSAACEAGLKEIPAFVLTPDMSKEKQLDLCLELAGAEKMLPLMSMARLAVLTDKFVDKPVKWLRERHNQHFWSITIDIFCRLKTLAASSAVIHNYFQKYDAPLVAAMAVVNLEVGFQEKIIKWAVENRVRPIELEKIISDISDCAKVEKSECEEVWDEIIGKISCETKSDYLREFKKILTERKNPLLTNLRKQTTNTVREFKKESGLEVIFDPDFEKMELEFKFKCKSEKEFIQKLKNALEKGGPIVKNLFDSNYTD